MDYWVMSKLVIELISFRIVAGFSKEFVSCGKMAYILVVIVVL